MTLLGKYKLYKLFSKPLNKRELEIINFIKSWLNDLIPFKMDRYPDSIFYMKNGKMILEEDDSTYIWVRYDDFWEVLDEEYNLYRIEIQNILKYFIEESLQRFVKIPNCNNHIFCSLIEETFRQSINTNFKNFIIRESQKISHESSKKI